MTPDQRVDFFIRAAIRSDNFDFLLVNVFCNRLNDNNVLVIIVFWRAFSIFDGCSQLIVWFSNWFFVITTQIHIGFNSCLSFGQCYLVHFRFFIIYILCLQCWIWFARHPWILQYIMWQVSWQVRKTCHTARIAGPGLWFRSLGKRPPAKSSRETGVPLQNSRNVPQDAASQAIFGVAWSSAKQLRTRSNKITDSAILR